MAIPKSAPGVVAHHERALFVDGVDFERHVLELAEVGAGVHDHAAADGAGDAAEKLDSAEVLARGEGQDLAGGGAGVEPQFGAVVGAPRRRAPRRRRSSEIAQPRSPPSRTSRFEPEPKARLRILRAAQVARSRPSAASDPGAAQASTGPPMRSVVWRVIGSSKVSSPSPASASASACLSASFIASPSSRTCLQDLLADHPDVAGAERDEDVAVAQLWGERGGDLGALAHVRGAEVARRAHLVDEPRR